MDSLDFRLKIIFPNFVDRAVLSGGAWSDGDLSLDALKDRVIGHVARSRSTDPDDTWIDIALDRSRRVGGLAVLNHNLSPSATMVLQGFRDAEHTDPAYNRDGEPAEVFPRAFRRGDIPFGEPNWWSLRPRAEDIGRVTTIAIILLPDPRTARYWRLRFVDPQNPAGFVDIGKVVLGSVFDPSHNYGYGAGLAVLDESRMTQSIGGTRYFDERGKRRRFTFGFEMLEEAREFGRLFDLTAEAGITRQLVVIPDPSNLIDLQRRSFCGTLREATMLEQVAFRRMNANFVIEEDI